MNAPTAPEKAGGLLDAALDGLSRDRKRMDSKWLYDEEGSRLFDLICGLPEYYPTRTETGILAANAPALAPYVPEGAALVEPGAGSSIKTRILLDSLPFLGAYAPVDISAEHLAGAAARLTAEHPCLPIHPVAADFTARISLPSTLERMPKLWFFPGSTIGNFTPPEAKGLLTRWRKIPGAAGLVLGADLRKDPARLVAAYDDAQGVTAAFNLNLLARMNRELGADFDLSAFRHEARWNEDRSRIEMHLVAQRAQTVRIGDREFRFEEDESLHTENSHKFSLDGLRHLAADAGWRVTEQWTDPDALFSVNVFVPA